MVAPKLFFTLILVICASDYIKGQAQVDRVVPTTHGPVRGYLDPEGGVFGFYGIPYATAPTGENRYKPPLPPPTRLYTLEAVETKIACPQSYLEYVDTYQLKLQEDCLIANVFVPDTNETNLPVMVQVHGGAFKVGFGMKKTPKNIVRSKKVIVINFNYRVGVTGFLCLGTEDVPGNAGLKDQVALLKWVKENIAYFGGNPNDITISGYSAGGVSVDLLMLSKMTEGLFHKVVPDSGASTAIWSVYVDPIESAKTLAKSLNFTNVDDIKALENFYKTASLQSLYPDVIPSFADGSFEFAACVEKDLGQEMFLDDAPTNIIASGNYIQLPMLYGITDFEGSVQLMDYSTWKDKMNGKFSDFLPGDLQFESEEQREDVAQKVKQFYFGNSPVGDETVSSFFNYFSDVMFIYPLLRSVKLHIQAGHNQIYLYEYTYPKVYEIPFTNGVTVIGAEHCAQTYTILDENKDNLSEQDTQVETYMRELWLNFFTTGSPVPTGSSFPAWPPVNSTERAPHMWLNATQELRGAMYIDRAKLWDEIYANHYRTPVPPNSGSNLVVEKLLLILLVLFTLRGQLRQVR